MPTENSLRNLRVTPEVRAANLEKMRVTRRRQSEAHFKIILERIAGLPKGLKQSDMAERLGVTIHMVSRAIRWEREQKIKGK